MMFVVDRESVLAGSVAIGDLLNSKPALVIRMKTPIGHFYVSPVIDSQLPVGWDERDAKI